MSRRFRSSHLHDDEDEMPPPYVSQTKRQSPRVGQSGTRASQANNRTARAGPSSQNDFDDSLMPDSSQTNRAGSRVLMEEDQENHLVSSVIRYLLAADRSKTLIQRANIIKQAIPGHGKFYKHIMSRVSETLTEVFGYNLVELEHSKYILTNNIPNENLRLQFSKSEKAELVLLFIALGHIFMTDESGCSEEELFDLFKRLDIIEENTFIHEYFGDVKYLITDKFVKQGYFEVVNIDRSDPPLQHYQWGPRAENELKPRQILEFMSKIFGGRPLNTWPVQFKIMQTREASNASD